MDKDKYLINLVNNLCFTQTRKAVFPINTNFIIIETIEFICILAALFYTLNLRPSVKRLGISIIFIGLPTILVSFYISHIMGIITLIASSFIVFYAFSKTYGVILDLGLIITASIIADNASRFIKFSFFTNQEIYLHAMLFVAIFSFVVFLYKIFMTRTGNAQHIPMSVQILIILIAGLTFLVLYFNIFIPANQDEILLLKINLAVQLTYLFSMLILFLYLLHNTKKENALKQTKLEQEQFSQYINALKQVNEEMQKFGQDYSNLINSMQQYMEEEDLKGLKSYFKKHILKAEEQTLSKNVVLSHLDNLKVIELKGLLTTKVLLADQLGIKVNVEIPEMVERIFMDIVDLTRIIGILMDNAIEASQHVEHGEINLAFLKTEFHSVIFVLENRTSTTSMNISKLYEENYSTKGKGRGIGLSNVKNILKDYPTTTMNTCIEDGWFIQEMQIR